MKPVISIQNLSKSFGKYKVLDDLSFEVPESSLFAFLGANGSGKTTTLRCLLHIYTPDKGEVKVFGKDYSNKIAKFVGYLPEERGLYLSSKVLETLIFFGRIKGMTQTAAKNFAESYLERVGIADKRDTLIKKLSSGQQQKVQLGITIINSPKLLILDEPTKGLDPVNRNLLMEILKELNEKGSTILFSTHQMDEVEKIASHLVMIKGGKAALNGEVSQIKKQFGEDHIQLQFYGKFEPQVNL